MHPGVVRGISDRQRWQGLSRSAKGTEAGLGDPGNLEQGEGETEKGAGGGGERVGEGTQMTRA